MVYVKTCQNDPENKLVVLPGTVKQSIHCIQVILLAGFDKENW